MLWICSRVGLVLGALALVTACDRREAEMAAPAEAASPYAAERDFKLVVAGRNLTDFRTEEDIARLLAQLGAPEKDVSRQQIANLLQNPGDAELMGLGGVPGRALLRALLPTFDEFGAFAGPLEQAEVVGQIQESVDGETGFYFRPGEPMHIWVQTITTSRRGGEAASVAQMYRVEVPANQMVVERRAGTGPSVFPGFADAAFAIPASMADRSVDGELVQFQYKLWAVGTEVQVTDYWVDLAYDPAGAPNWTKYQPATAPSDVAGIFKPDAAACFDMMFRYDPTLEVSDGGALVEGRLPPGSKPPYYCLGRCKNPPIVNTK